MRRTAFLKLAMVLFLPASCSFAGEFVAGPAPKVEVSAYRLTLSSAMAAALKTYTPEFIIWEAADFDPDLLAMYAYGGTTGEYTLNYQSPSAVIGDFNGDKVPDAALLGHDRTHKKMLVLLSGADGYSVVEISSYPLEKTVPVTTKTAGGELSQCLELVHPGKIKADPGYKRPEITLKTDAFKYGGERGSSLYYYKDGKFISYALSD